MKKCSGRLRHILLCGILLGLLGTVGLCYMGYEKANTAEAKATPIAELRNTYIGAIDIQSDTTLREQLLQKLIGNEELTESIAASWSDHVFAELIVENYYLPKDDTISTTIGQKLLNLSAAKSLFRGRAVLSLRNTRRKHCRRTKHRCPQADRRGERFFYFRFFDGLKG